MYVNTFMHCFISYSKVDFYRLIDDDSTNCYFHLAVFHFEMVVALEWMGLDLALYWIDLALHTASQLATLLNKRKT